MMISAYEWLKKVCGDSEMWEYVYIKAEDVVMSSRVKESDFCTGLFMGFWLGRFYGNNEKDKDTHSSESGDREPER
jgi:hypothetical protein